MAKKETETPQETPQESQQKGICFIITPIGEAGSAIRRKTDGLISNVIKPICEKLKLQGVPAHEIDNSGSITNQVIKAILESKLVIANLTGLNPNVMYELAIRHATGLPIVCLAENMTDLPFDINAERTIFYSDDMLGAIELKLDLEKKIRAALKDTEIDNPIYRVIKDRSILNRINSLSDKKEKEPLLLIVDKLNNLEKTINSLNSSRSFLQPSDIRLQFDRPITKIHQDIGNEIEQYLPYCFVDNHNNSCSDSLTIHFLKMFDVIKITTFLNMLAKKLKDKFDILIVDVEQL